MKRQAYQHPELRDANDNIIQQGTYGKESPLVNSTNDGVLDYINNNLEALYDNINGSRIYVASKAALPATGDLSAMYIAEDTGKWYLWDGAKYIETDNTRKIADEAIAARDAAKASQSAAKTSENNAKTSETNAAASKTAAADSASAAAGSAGAAKTSETNAASSKTAAATSATNAANSAKAAAASATAAANSAREQQADWAVTDTTSKAFVKNKPSIKLSGTQNVSASLTINPTSSNYNSGLRLNQGSDSWATIYLGAGLNTTSGVDEYAWGISRDSNYALGIWPSDISNRGKKGLYFPLTDRATLDGKTIIVEGDTVGKATSDAAGNNIQNTYAKKSDLSTSVSTSSLTVTGETSVPTANAGNSSKAIANTEFVAKSISALVNGAPDQLNTLNELAKALGNDSNFAATLTAELAKKLNSAEAESTYATKTEARVLPGTVTAFSGAFKDGYPVDKSTGLVNREWHLCDGTNGTPDLRNRFIYGGDGTNNGATGGEESVKLTKDNIPEHSHTASVSSAGEHTHTAKTYTEGGSDHYNNFSCSYTRYSKGTATVNPSGSHTHTITIDNTGGNQPHNNMPPYYTLAFIMKI